MRTHVTVDGITLSRKQVEAAAKKINEPEIEDLRVVSGLDRGNE